MMITEEAVKNLENFIRVHGKRFAGRQWNLAIAEIDDVKITKIEIDFTQHKVVMAHFQVILKDSSTLNFAKAISPIDGSMDHNGYHY